ncbi:MAG: fasciclin domain-containing protein [Sphingomicrobium sp.]
MTRSLLSFGLAASLVALAACDQAADGNAAAPAQTGEAKDAAGNKTIAASLDQNGKFFQAAKAAGLDATLAGPGPYTVLAPDDAAFGKLPAGAADTLMKPESRNELTRVLTYHILPGTVLAEDIAKAIDNGKGKAVLATMGGSTLTATKDGGKVVLTDSAGGKARIVTGDQRFSNGVVHSIDTVLMPSAS